MPGPGRARCAGRARVSSVAAGLAPSNPDLLDVLDGHLVGRPVVELGRARALMRGDRLGALERTFAVGTALTGGPPHRSQRVLLTHWAPTSGHDAQSLFGIRVQCSMLDDFHQPSVVDGIEESTDVRVEYPVHFLVNRAPLSRQATWVMS